VTSGTHPSPPDTGDISDRDLLLAAAEAEAEAAEAVAAAARARARAATLRRRAGSAVQASTHPNPNDTPDSDDPVPGPEDRQARQPATTAERTLDDDHADTASDAATDAEPESDLEPAATNDPGSKPEGSRRHKRPRLGAVRHIRRRTAGVAVAAIVVCAGLGSSGYMMWRHHEVSAKQHREAEFVAAARQGVTTLTSLDFNHAADDVKRVLDDSTGAFRNDFQSRADDFAKVIQQSKVATQGRVDAAAVQSMTDDSAVVLVAATSEVTNSAGAKQEPRAWRLSVTVERVDGQLKMSKVEFVP
jgi:Mce-associated membrane protein